MRRCVTTFLAGKLKKNINCTIIRYFLVIFDFRIKFTRNQWVGKIVGKINNSISLKNQNILKSSQNKKVIPKMESFLQLTPEKKTPFSTLLVKGTVTSILQNCGGIFLGKCHKTYL